MKTSAIIIALLAQAMGITAVQWLCCTETVDYSINSCTSLGVGAGCCQIGSDPTSGHGCDDNSDFPHGRQVQNELYANKHLLTCGSGGVQFCLAS